MYTIYYQLIFSNFTCFANCQIY